MPWSNEELLEKLAMPISWPSAKSAPILSLENHKACFGQLYNIMDCTEINTTSCLVPCIDQVTTPDSASPLPNLIDGDGEGSPLMHYDNEGRCCSQYV